MKVEILGVKIDQVNLDQTLNKINEFLVSAKANLIVTVNAEFIVEAQNNSTFKSVLNQADLSVCDSSGVMLASGKKLKRVPGVDLTKELLERNNYTLPLKIFLLSKADGIEGSIEKLALKYPDKIVGYARGGKINFENWQLSDNEEIINAINKSQANVLLVGYGQVQQEMWLKNNLVNLPLIKVAIGVGGAFDFLSGQVLRAPKILRQLGLEWLFRLFYQPKRFKRIFNATIKFPWLVIIDKIKSPTQR